MNTVLSLFYPVFSFQLVSVSVTIARYDIDMQRQLVPSKPERFHLNRYSKLQLHHPLHKIAQASEDYSMENNSPSLFIQW